MTTADDAEARIATSKLLVVKDSHLRMLDKLASEWQIDRSEALTRAVAAAYQGWLTAEWPAAGLAAASAVLSE